MSTTTEQEQLERAATRMVEYLLDLSHLVETSPTLEERAEHREKMRDQQKRITGLVIAGLRATSTPDAP